MTYDLFIALLVFASIAAFTPGPNNTILMASGIQHGFRQTIPMIMGVTLGFPFMIAVVGLGIGKLLEQNPTIYSVLRVLSAAYMIWLAWKIATAKPTADGDGVDGNPLTFFQAASFQWVNPKAWIIAITALSTYTLSSHYYQGVGIIVATTVFMGLASATTWAAFGVGLKHVLNDPRYFKAINIALALALVASLWPMLRH